MADGVDHPPAVGGPGWRIDERSLLPLLTDERAFRTAHADDPALDGIVALWSGDAAAALAAFVSLIDRDPANRRFRALRADAWRDLGRLDEATTEYRRLLQEYAGTPAEAVLWQHLGKVHFVAADFGAAVECFRRALELRLDDGDAELIASSRLAVARAADAASD